MSNPLEAVIMMLIGVWTVLGFVASFALGIWIQQALNRRSERL